MHLSPNFSPHQDYYTTALNPFRLHTSKRYMKLLSLLFIALLFCLSGCEMPFYVAVPEHYAPTSFFGGDNTTIVLINQFNAENLGISNKKKTAAIKSGAYMAIDAAAKRLAQLPHVKTINLTDSTNFKVDTNSIKLIAQKYKATYVLVLKSYYADIVLDETTNNDYKTYSLVNFLLYESNGLYYKKLNGRGSDPQTKPQYMKMQFTGLYNQSALTPAPVNYSAAHGAQDALKAYFSYTQTHSRPMYDDDFLLPAIRQFQTSNYIKADSLLRPFIADSNRVRAGKAYYALAVVNEAKGDFGAAIDFARLALKIDGENEYAPGILGDLQQTE